CRQFGGALREQWALQPLFEAVFVEGCAGVDERAKSRSEDFLTLSAGLVGPTSTAVGDLTRSSRKLRRRVSRRWIGCCAIRARHANAERQGQDEYEGSDVHGVISYSRYHGISS